VNNPEHLVPPRPDQMVILIAEDEAVVRNVVRIALEAEGYFVLAACDGEEALTLSRKYPGEIHAVLSDVNMPRLDGLQLRSALLRERPGVRTMLMSGQVDLSPDAIPFIQKPFGPTELKQRMRQFLAQSLVRTPGDTNR
jgi:two-component system cell cycle sensor histidine kinase/response regulator CckA